LKELNVEIKVNDYLTWEYSDDPDIQYLDCPAPLPVKNFLPDWFKHLKGNILEYLPEGFADQNTIRHCHGFRGLLNIGYTIPLPETIDGHDTYFSRGRLHPEMLHGTQWANKGEQPWTNDDQSLYEFRLRLLHWPWRAKMPKGWRMLILPYMLDWSPDWQEFAGSVEPNYNITLDGTGLGSAIKWTQIIDLQHNYYNLETVIALSRQSTVNRDTVTFCAVPLFDPGLLNEQSGD